MPRSKIAKLIRDNSRPVQASKAEARFTTLERRAVRRMLEDAKVINNVVAEVAGKLFAVVRNQILVETNAGPAETVFLYW